ncbi:MAG: hypothetical protein U0670_06260 [Anaerolineae bacterium]
MTDHENELPHRDRSDEPGIPDSSDLQPVDVPPNDGLPVEPEVNSAEDEPESTALSFDAQTDSPPESQTTIDVDSLSMAQVVGMLFKHPVQTLELIGDVARTPSGDPVSVRPSVPRKPSSTMPRFASPIASSTEETRDTVPTADGTSAPAPIESSSTPQPGIHRADGKITLTVTLPVPQVGLGIPSVEPLPPEMRTTSIVQFVLRVVGFGAALWGGWILLQAPVQGDPVMLTSALPFWIVGMVLWFIAEFLEGTFARREPPVPIDADAGPVAEATANPMVMVAPRLILFGITLVLTFLARIGTQGNFVTLTGFLAWVGSMIAAVWTFAPRGWTPLRAVRQFVAWLGGIRLRFDWVAVGLIAIMLIGGYFRFTAMDTPPEMTSDHIEKIINAQEILDGQPRVFFTNNGGREPIQMYLMALLSEVPLPGLGINFFTLKLLSALEGFFTLPFIFWLGRVVIGERDRKLGNLVGLAAAALVAVSYWHETLSHLGLRIVLTSWVMALLLIFLIRGLRSGQRSQFVLAGLTLGIGLYAYQAVRMAPLVVIAALVIGGLYSLRNLKNLGRLAYNGVALVVVAIICFVPMLGFISEEPDAFFQRTSTRILGDEVITETDAQGNTTTRQATLGERIGVVLPQFTENLRNAALSFNFKGDGTWFQSAPYHPFMDAITGAFLLLGLVAWVMLLFRRRDPGIDLWLPMILIMLLPSALAIAFPNENPSATRLSGVLPGVYVVAGYGLVVLTRQTARIIGRRIGFVIAAGTAAALVLWAFTLNQKTFTVDYRTEYMNSHFVYSEPGHDIRSFVDSGGAWSNVFFIFTPYWWDHRGVIIEAGNIHLPIQNSIAQGDEPNRDHVPEVLRDGYRRTDEYRFDPNKPIFFLYADSDPETGDLLQQWFPEGTAIRHSTYQTNEGDPYWTFYVPPLGEERFRRWLEENGSPLTPQ